MKPTATAQKETREELIAKIMRSYSQLSTERQEVVLYLLCKCVAEKKKKG